MIKQLFTFALLGLVTLSVSAYDFKINCIAYNILSDNNEVSVAKGDDYNGSIVIPEKVTYDGATYSVITIGDEAFAFCSDLMSVTIPNSVTAISDKAFKGCSSLTSLTIPNSVTTIGDEAFEGCCGLTSIIVESENPTFDSRDNCNAIINTETNTLIAGCKRTKIPNTVKTIGDNAFCGCEGLTSVFIPNSVTTIGKLAFGVCKGLTSVTIPNTVTTIGERAFVNCHNLVSINIPYSVTAIGDLAFLGCRGLRSIIVESGNPSFDSRDNCNAIIDNKTNTLIVGCKNTIIPNTVTSIGVAAFYNCDDLMSVTIPHSVTTICNMAFLGCSGLTDITIPNSVTIIYGGAFKFCSGLNRVTIPYSVTSIGDEAFNHCSGLTSVMIPNSVTEIGRGAFSYCTSLTSVTIPRSATTIDDYAFGECRNLTKIINLATVPLDISGKSVFVHVDRSSCSLLVPEESINLYKTAPVWKEFDKIEPIDPQANSGIR